MDWNRGTVACFECYVEQDMLRQRVNATSACDVIIVSMIIRMLRSVAAIVIIILNTC